jgi:hypothetical protein
MSAGKESFARAPERLSSAEDAVYVRRRDTYAVHDRKPGSPAPGATELLNDGAIAVHDGEPAAEASRQEGRLGPVYSLEPGGALAVPTGLLFVRFAEGVAAETRRDELERAGFEIVKSPGYAPQAAWVRSRSDDIAGTLAQIPALERLPQVERVEPEMLMPRARRAG